MNYAVGSTIILKNGETLLVGDVNTLGGVCDDCTFDKDEVAEVVQRDNFEDLRLKLVESETRVRELEKALLEIRDNAPVVNAVDIARAVIGTEDIAP